MNEYQPQPPSPELLAAYLDGELDGHTRQDVEDWLAAHPEDAALLDSFRRVDALVHAVTPPEPDPAAWSGVLDRIAARTAPTPPRRRLRIASLAWIAVAALSATAAGLLWLVLPTRPVPPDPTAPVEAFVAPWPMATDADVEIISMDMADVNAIVVGEPPLRPGALVLASADEVLIKDSGGAKEVLVPSDKSDGPSWPMVWSPGEPAGKAP